MEEGAWVHSESCHQSDSRNIARRPTGRRILLGMIRKLQKLKENTYWHNPSKSWLINDLHPNTNNTLLRRADSEVLLVLVVSEFSETYTLCHSVRQFPSGGL